MKKCIFFCMLCSFLVNSNYLIAQDEVTLKFQPPEGASIKYETQVKSETNMSGTIMPMTMASTLKSTIKEKATEGTAMTSSIERMQLSTNIMGQQIDYDSEKPDTTNPVTKQFGTLLGTMIGKEFTTVVASNGEVKAMDGIEDLLPPGMAGMNMSQLVPNFAFFPAGELSVGSTWKNKQTISNQGIDMILDNTWELTDLKNGTATLQLISNVSASPDSQRLKTMNGKINGDQSGTFEVEIATGITMNTNLTSNIKFQMTPPGQSEMVVNTKTEVEMKGSKE